jgi:uncharacterized protein YndB with AHSA1/START domain
MGNFVASGETDVSAKASDVWTALTDPQKIKKYFFGSEVATDWQVGSAISWSGEYDGKPYTDKGKVIEVEPDRLLKHTHFSAMSGHPDVPENYHTLTYILDEHGDETHVTLTQDNNGSAEEAKHASEMWASMLSGLKETVEAG